MKKAIVLLSGGIDSSTTLYIAQNQGYKPLCLIFDYHQRHRREIKSAKKIAQSITADYKILKISLPESKSSLLNPNISLKPGKKKIPLTYIPARNIIFLSYAVSYAESYGISAIFIGANQIDYSGYPDCRETFISAFNRMIGEGTQKKKIKVIVPLIKMTKGEIIKLGMKLKVPYHLTWSCYAENVVLSSNVNTAVYPLPTIVREKAFTVTTAISIKRYPLIALLAEVKSAFLVWEPKEWKEN